MSRDKITYILKSFIITLISITLFACNSNSYPPTDNDLPSEEIQMVSKISLVVNNYSFLIDLEDNNASKELVNLLKDSSLTLKFSDYGNFEKVTYLGFSLPNEDSYITTNPGDIVLYNSNSLVVFYGNNSWNYTRIGKIEDITNLKAALGDNDVTMTFQLIS